MKYRIYTPEQIAEVKKLFEDGKNKCEISRITGIPRGTLKSWIIPSYRKLTDKQCSRYTSITDFDIYLDTKEKQGAYSFILAVYLCDGCISTFKTWRAPSLRLYNNSKYVKNINEWAQKLRIILPDNSVNVYRQLHANCCVVGIYSRKLLDLFPQHGVGRKNQREIKLSEWQMTILLNNPQDFLRGCFQSDGCIYTHTQSDRKCFSFSNTSKGIMDLFILALSRVGIIKSPTYSPEKNLYRCQITKRDAVVILEGIIPYKE